MDKNDDINKSEHKLFQPINRDSKTTAPITPPLNVVKITTVQCCIKMDRQD
jgi:hypothetical protein